MKNLSPKNQLLIAAAVFIVAALIVVLLCAAAGHPAPAVVTAVAAVASVEVARRKLAGAGAVIEVKEEAVETLKASFEENLANAEAKEVENAKGITAMTLEEKVALANGTDNKPVEGGS
jgi:uncharacterized protein (TIGR03382 family)